MNILSLSLGAAAALAAATTAQAGGFTPPAVEIEPVAAVIETAPAGGWAGGYAGASLGYTFGGDDKVGVDVYEDDVLVERALDLTNLKVKGPTVGVHAGYRWQRGNWVFGPELAIEGGSVEDSRDVLVGTDVITFESQVNYIATLAMKTGYAVNPQTLIYGTAGLVHGDFDYTLGFEGEQVTNGYTANGYSVGLGAERKVSDRMSVFAEWQYRDFGTNDVDFIGEDTTLRSIATPSHHNIKAGVNFSF